MEEMYEFLQESEPEDETGKTPEDTEEMPIDNEGRKNVFKKK